MNQYDSFAAAAAREEIERNQLGGSDLYRQQNALIYGWDCISDLARVDPPPGGVWRTRHFEPRLFFPDVDDAPLGMFEGAESSDDLYTRLWRLLRIFPDASDWRDEDFETKAPDIFAKLDDSVIAHRDQFLTALFGHPLRDHADFMSELLRDDPELGKLVLEKRYSEAIVRDPEILDRPWPAAVRNRWNDNNLDFLPPFIHALLIGELQRLAQNDCSHIALSFFEDGSEASLAATAKVCTGFQKRSNQALPAREIYGECIVGMIGLAPFQTSALQPSRSLLLRYDSDAAVKDALIKSWHLSNIIAARGRPLIDFVCGLHSRSPSPLLAESVAQHLDRSPDRATKNGSFAHRAGFATTYWGLDWLTHAYMGLSQLAVAAAEYNKKFRPQGPVLRQNANTKIGRPIGLRQSIARIPYFWLETTNAAAYRNASEKLAETCTRNANTRKRYAKTSSEISKVFEDWEPSSVFDDQVATIRETEVALAMRSAQHAPHPGMPGYTAQYRPHLWLDDENDDIGFWIGRERQSDSSPLSNTLKASCKAQRAFILADIDRYRETSPSIAARVNQNLAMTINAFATDPQHSWFRRKGF